MRRSRTVACASCDAGWDAATARFCGHCGQLLTPRPPDAAAEHGRRSRRLPVVVAAACVLVLAAGVMGTTALELPRSQPDPQVELSAEDTIPSGERLGAEEREAALAPFDPHRLRCEPRGCERWRMELGDNHREVVALGSVVVAMVDGAAVAVDPRDGEEMWRLEPPEEYGIAEEHAWPWLFASDTGEHLAVLHADRRVIQVVRADGREHWDAEDRGGPHAHGGFVGDEVLVTAAQSPELHPTKIEDGIYSHPELIVARDVRTGALLWERDGAAMLSLTEDGVVLRDDDEAVLLDARTGDVRARMPLDPSAWMYRHERFLIEYDDRNGWHRLRSPADLAVLTGDGVFDEIQPLPGQPLALGVVRGERRTPDAGDRDGGGDPQDGGPGAGDRLVLIDADGSVRWEVEVDRAHRLQLCCPGPRVDGDAIMLPATARDGGSVRRSLATGEVLATAQTDEDVPSPDTVRVVDSWWAGGQTTVETDGETTTIRYGTVSVTLRGQGAWPVTHEPPFVVTDGRTVMGVEPVDDAG
ncbi:PQQ-binding-like beta-propeller repeat protein [Egicoccus sp. AB-alg2]|uniref:outer membrane protein assembly factor BamB family protein n=1 Tax=Egicoccus sp. AB-alg2 TaxID=3242693 RepID=UPI00359D6164